MTPLERNNKIIKERRDRKFTTEHKAEFKKLYLEHGVPAYKLATKFKIRRSTACDYARSISDTNVKSLKCVNRKLSKENVLSILNDLKSNINVGILVLKYKVHESTISSIKNGHTWKEVHKEFHKKSA